MTPSHRPGPIAQLRHAAESPLALILGAALGGLVPASTFVVAHVGELVRVEGGGVVLASWHPGWLLVLGGLLFSGKTVYAWTRAAFEDRAKALGFVVLVEGVLLLSPSPALSYVALAYLVAINALGTGAALALRHREDRAREASQRAPESSPQLVRETSPEPARESRVAELRTSSPAVPRPLPAPKPAALPAPTSPDTAEDLYDRALEFARQVESLSAEALRRALRCRQPTAAALVSQLEAAGVVGAPDPADRGRRPVLLSARSERGSAGSPAPSPHA
jgi:hypothetical protein